MKIRNKKTGKIITAKELFTDGFVIDLFSKDYDYFISKLNKIVEEWEDYEELKEYWYVSCDGRVFKATTDEDEYNEDHIAGHREIGNYFETKEKAEKEAEKLKAWKRLEDKGFRFILDEETEMPMFVYSGADCRKCITNAQESKQCRDDIKLLFGGENEN